MGKKHSLNPADAFRKLVAEMARELAEEEERKLAEA